MDQQDKTNPTDLAAWERPSDLIERPIRVPKKSTRDCFAPYADAPTDPPPLCYRCGEKSKGAEFLEFMDVMKMTLAIVRWSCGCDGRRSFAILPNSLGVSWKMIAQTGPSEWKMKRLSQADKEKNARVS